ncbi:MULTISPECIES: threonine/serine exporter family protein [Vibrio]|uniref:Threonine/serine exporter n=1 Tax=Vibrio algicola TaxID=2662262 RepID=A0A5Q0TKT1_9VIBR|nr:MULTISPECIES: threonine/serine exporter family protein [Vibrio]MBD1575256.1 threonine/serine exporter family protein [Vibrio sp. S11_S32]
MEANQKNITRFIINAGQMLLAHGAESTVVADITRRLGLACGMEEVEVSLSASSIIITTIMDDNCVTTVRRSPDRGINMSVVTDIQHICIMVERRVLDFTLAQHKLEQIKPKRHNRWIVVLMIGLSCAAFSHLAGGDRIAFAITFVASAIGMIVRQEIAHRNFNPLLNFAVTSFVITLISSQAVIYQIGSHPFLPMASSVLMMVPGFPLINAAADMLKGYINMGIARFVMATLLTLATSIGIVGAMTLTGAWGWVH